MVLEMSVISAMTPDLCKIIDALRLKKNDQ